MAEPLPQTEIFAAKQAYAQDYFIKRPYNFDYNGDQHPVLPMEELINNMSDDYIVRSSTYNQEAYDMFNPDNIIGVIENVCFPTPTEYIGTASTCVDGETVYGPWIELECVGASYYIEGLILEMADQGDAGIVMRYMIAGSKAGDDKYTCLYKKSVLDQEYDADGKTTVDIDSAVSNISKIRFIVLKYGNYDGSNNSNVIIANLNFIGSDKRETLLDMESTLQYATSYRGPGFINGSYKYVGGFQVEFGETASHSGGQATTVITNNTFSKVFSANATRIGDGNGSNNHGAMVVGFGLNPNGTAYLTFDSDLDDPGIKPAYSWIVFGLA